MCILLRGLSNELINMLNAAPFWQQIIQDPDLHPAIRDGHVTVYYRGAALLRNLHLEGNTLCGMTHFKYVPLRRPVNQFYVPFQFQNNSLEFSEHYGALPIGDGDPDILNEYKRLIQASKNSLESETIHHLTHWRAENSNLIVDQESEFQLPGERGDKIDLLHYDRRLQCAAFVEVKGIDDPRLYQAGNGPPEVIGQLARYRNRIAAHRADVLTAFNQMVEAKRQLGLGARLEGVPADVKQVLSKAVLLIGGCCHEDVRAILEGEGQWGPLQRGLNEVAAGLILCGRNGASLELREHRQCTVFNSTVLQCQ